jgi:hypothetical protein
MFKRFYFFLLFVFLSSCMSAQDHRAAVSDTSSDRITVGKVQKEIKVGMSSSM